VRKVVSLSFLVILLINVFGYFISFSVQRNKIKEVVKHFLRGERSEATQQFAFTEQQFASLNMVGNDSEFTLDGSLYDVVNKELRDGRIVITAYYDHQETGLLSRFISYFSEENQSTKGKQILPVFSLLEFVFSSYEWKCYDTFVCCNIPSYVSNLINPSLDLASPPPDLIFS
jgi:hypothetical protein